MMEVTSYFLHVVNVRKSTAYSKGLNILARNRFLDFFWDFQNIVCIFL
jgi:hypothetical protein